MCLPPDVAFIPSACQAVIRKSGLSPVSVPTFMRLL